MKIHVSIAGPGEEATKEMIRNAEEIAAACAAREFVVITGGRDCGVMAAACRGAKSAGGIAVGILPSNTRDGSSPDLDVAVVTGMGEARNVAVALSGDVVIACGMNAGTASEIALALRDRKRVILVGLDENAAAFFVSIAKDPPAVVSNATDAIRVLDRMFGPTSA